MIADLNPEQERHSISDCDSSSPAPLAPPKNTGRVWLAWGAGLALLLLGAWLSRPCWLPVIGTSLNVSDPLKPARAVLILPGSDDSRQIVAAGLIKAGYADLALVPDTRELSTAANPHVRPGEALSATEMTRQILIRRGISESRIVTLEGDSDNTLGDAMALDRYFQRFGVIDVIIVTNANHSRRARWAFTQVLSQQQSHLRFYTAPNGYDASVWWISRKGRQAVLSEWVKFAIYFTYYGPGWIWCMVLFTIGGTLGLHRRQASRCHLQGPEHVGVRHPDQSGRRA